MSIEINQFNLNAGLLEKHKNLVHRSVWHEIVVENVKGLERDAVLRPIMKCCRPLDFIPARFTLIGNEANFLLKNCGSAIEKLCTQGLVIANPQDKEKPFKITVKLCCASSANIQINIQANLMAVLNKRFNNITRLLNLENFAKDAELVEYCPLSQSKLFSYVLHLAKNIQFKMLKLSNNDIASLKSMEALEHFKTPICVDLRNNSIEDITEINNMKHLNVTELLLDGNPICNNYDATNYGRVMKECLTTLEKLDGINIQSMGFLPFRRNFLCNYSGFDLVDQFLEHYFTLYDAQNRAVLGEVYHKDALFSLTSMYIPMQSTSTTAKLSTYKHVSRNLKNLSDFSKCTQSLYAGRAKIIELLTALPLTEHDPYSFTADLIMYTDTTAILIVTGVFRECSDSPSEPALLLGFSRTFVLLSGQHGHYSIINEMLHITNATSNRAAGAFKYPKVPQLISIPPPQNSKERSELTDTLTVITGLRTEWSQRCLEECKYDFKEGLSLFIELYKKDKIPKSAFHTEQEKIEFKNRRKIVAQSTSVTSTPPSCLDKQRTPMASPNKSTQSAGQPLSSPGDLKSITPFAKTRQVYSTHTEPLSPDNIWKKYANEEKNNHCVDEVIEVIDLIDSSGEELHSAPESIGGENIKKEVNNRATTPAPSSDNGDTHEELIEEKCRNPEISVENRNGQNQIKIGTNVATVPSRFQKKVKRPVQRVVSPSPPKTIQTEKKEVRERRMGKFQLEFMDFQQAYYLQGFQNVLEIGLNIISKYGTMYEVFEAVMTWLYRTNIAEARVFNNRVNAMAKCTIPFISVHRIELIVAICEYKFGNPELGEWGFRTLMDKYQMWANPVTEFCKVMIEKGQVDKARELLRLFVSGDHPMRKKIININRMLTSQYQVSLL